MSKFICNKCPFINPTQEGIAVHYLQKHLQVDFCSLSKPVDGFETTHQDLSQKAEGKAGVSIDDNKQLEVVPRRGRSLDKKKCSRKVGSANGGQRDGSTDAQNSSVEKLPSKEETSSPVLRQSVCREATNEEAYIDGRNQFEPSDDELGRGKRKRSTPKRYITDDQLQKSSAEMRSECLVQKSVGKDTQKESPKTLANKKALNVKDCENEAMLPRITRHRKVAQRISPHTSTEHSPEEESKLEPTSLRQSSRRNVQTQDRLKEKRQNTDEPKEEKTETLTQKIERLPIPYKQYKSKLDSMLSEWNTTQEQKKKDSIKTCTFEGCSLDISENELGIHLSCHAKSMDGLKCPNCPFMCLFWRHMRKHLRTEHGSFTDRVFQCDQSNCDSTFVRFNQLRKHVMDKHLTVSLVDTLLTGAYDPNDFLKIDKNTQENVPYQSPKRQSNQNLENEAIQRKKKIRLINKSEDSKRDYRSKVTFVCDLCLSRFTQEDTMETHKNGHLAEQENVLLCLECGLGCSGGDALKDHYQAEHKRLLMRYQCQECPFATDRFHQMSSHQAVHSGQKEVMCDQCGKLFANQYNLKVHEFRKHTTEEQKTVVCSACPYRCADKSILRDHIKQHHKSMLKNPIYHPCPHCDYIGHKLKSLHFHMRIHTEQRSFKCDFCPYAGKTKNHLKIHLQTHANFKTTSCQQCDFKGSSKKRLSEHLMSQHLKVEPHLCKICGWRTAYSGNMWKHINNHKKTLGDKMPDDPATVELELLKDVELPEMPRAPTGKTRQKADYGNLNSSSMNGTGVSDDGHSQEGLYIHEIPTEQGGMSGNLQVLQITEGSDGSNYIPNEIQIVQIQDDGLGQIPEQVVAHFRQDACPQESMDNTRDQERHMEILISHHEASGNGAGSEKTVEVLRVGEDGTVFTTAMNPDVEVAVLALAHLEPSIHTGEPVSVAEEDGHITVLQTLQQNEVEAGSIEDAAVSAAVSAGIHVEAVEESEHESDSPLGQVLPGLSDEGEEAPVSDVDVSTTLPAAEEPQD